MKLTKKSSILILALGFSVLTLISGCDQNPNINLDSGTITNTQGEGIDNIKVLEQM